jgi:hypothetical protein
MHLILVVGACVFASARLSFQAPPKTSLKQQAMNMSSSDSTSLLYLIKNRPKGPFSVEFQSSFANHPGVKKLNDLKGEAYVQHAISLRKAVEQEDPSVKLAFRRTLQNHMDNTNVDPELKQVVKTRLSKVTKAGVEKRFRFKKQTEDRKAWYQSKREAYLLRTKRQKEREAVQGGLSPYELMMQGLKLPQDSSAAEIEQKSRHIVLEDTRYTTPQLRKYLKNRFDPIDVENAIAARSYYYTLSRNKRDNKAQGKQRVKAFRARHKADKKGQSNQQEHHQQDSTSSNGAIKLVSEPTASLHSPLDNVDPLGKSFHQADWWNDMYTD